MSSVVLALIIGGAIGLALGMLGGGGSILTVPALVYLLQQEAHAAIGMSLLIVGGNALIGAWMHARQGHVRVREAVMFGAYGIVAAFAGARVSRLIPAELLLVLFSVLMLIVAWVMLRRKDSGSDTESAPLEWWRVALGGVGVGLLTGFLGVGGGFLIVPALVMFLGLSMRQAVGSSLIVIAMNSAAGFAGHLSDGGIDWVLIGLVIAGGIAGLRLGAHLAQKVAPATLRRTFAYAIALLGVVMLGTSILDVIQTV